MAYTRLSGRSGQPIELNVSFRRNGIAEDPYAIRRVDIYKQSVEDANLVGQILFPTPDTSDYPAPAVSTSAGIYTLEFDIPSDYDDGIYFDVWRFIGTTPDNLTGYDYTDEDLWLSQCNKFWVFKDCWFLDDGLVTPRIAFEPLDSRFRKGEIRTLEVGLMPLPLYDWDRSRFGAMIPQTLAYITVETEHCEILTGLEKAPCRIGLRQGTYRTNPYVVQATLDASAFLKGSYRYRITLELPNGETRVSEPFRFHII